jgi:hypothetical protein
MGKSVNLTEGYHEFLQHKEISLEVAISAAEELSNDIRSRTLVLTCSMSTPHETSISLRICR